MNDINESLYYAEIKLLTKYCHNCLDNKMKNKLIMFVFKKMLYDNATTLGLTEDATRYYNEMLNLLDLRTCECSISNCKTCEDGFCELCK